MLFFVHLNFYCQTCAVDCPENPIVILYHTFSCLLHWVGLDSKFSICSGMGQVEPFGLRVGSARVMKSGLMDNSEGYHVGMEKPPMGFDCLRELWP